MGIQPGGPTQYGPTHHANTPARIALSLALSRCSRERLGMLVEQIALISSSPDTRELLLSILDSVARIVASEAASLFLLDPATGELILQIPTGPARSEIQGVRIPAGQGICGWVASHNDGLTINNPASDPRFFGDVARGGFVTRNLVCVPVRRPDGTVIGVLQALNRMDHAPFDGEDRALLEALADQAAIALERERMHGESLAHARVMEQLNLAREIQNGLWPRPENFAGGVRLAGISIPASHVGGDYYDFFSLPGGRIGLALADVCGKGPGAALLMCTLRAALRAHAEHCDSPATVVAHINRTLVRDTSDGQFATLFFAVYDPSRRELEYVNAGHNPPMLVDTRTGRIAELTEGGPLVGAFDGLEFTSGSLCLEPGQRLVVFSDGVTEAQTGDEEEFGEQRLMELLGRMPEPIPPESVIENLFEVLAEFTGESPQLDDLTLLVIDQPENGAE
jgi:sigma-B regulation protein RsbU (phosphoserine phosphatase)